MDPDVFPNTIDYWGPTGMMFLRNPQYMQLLHQVLMLLNPELFLHRIPLQDVLLMNVQFGLLW